MAHVMPATLQATDWGTFLVRISVVVPTIILLIAFFIV
jgi:hypothetical protein